jgi:hypothetical protein
MTPPDISDYVLSKYRIDMTNDRYEEMDAGANAHM